MDLSTLPTYGWATVIVAALVMAYEIMRRAWTGRDEVSAQRAALKAQLRLALRQGRVTDAHRLRRALQALGCLVAALCLAGCAGSAPAPIIVGERILMPQPGQALTVPPLVPPAAQWYLVDDVGLAGWLGIDP